MTVSTPAHRPSAADHYEIVRPLGEGGMAHVFLARHRATGREVVVKRLRSERSNDPTARRLFDSELRMMCRFRHPFVVSLLDASGADDDPPFLVLEFVHGITLAELVEREGPLSADRAGDLLGPLCIVLAAAHEQGILHRDLTASNLMIVNAGSRREAIKVMDFGLARPDGFYIAQERLQGDDANIGGGTPDYLCPEQIRGESVDARGDLYSVGVMLYAALTGHVPFESAQEVDGLLQAHLHSPPPPFAAFGVSNVPAAVEDLVLRCMAKHPADRPQSARELAACYGEALGKPIVDADAFGPPPAAALPVETKPEVALDNVIDRVEAWMPEQIAAVKLRGFIAGVGGEVLDSEPGRIRVHVPLPAKPAPPPRGFWARLRPPPPPQPRLELIELYLHKQSSGWRSQVEIAVVRPERAETVAEREAGHAFCQGVCRELRSYLMTARA
jgi:serine/threonine-protein kinase